MNESSCLTDDAETNVKFDTGFLALTDTENLNWKWSLWQKGILIKSGGFPVGSGS